MNNFWRFCKKTLWTKLKHLSYVINCYYRMIYYVVASNVTIVKTQWFLTTNHTMDVMKTILDAGLVIVLNQ